MTSDQYDKSVKVRDRVDGANNAATRTGPSVGPGGRQEHHNWVGSGRSYQRHRQLKAARSSSSSSVASSAGAGPTATSITTTTSDALLLCLRTSMFTLLGTWLVVYISSSGLCYHSSV